MRLDGAVVALTGAGGGIGRQLAIRLASEGAELALSDRHSERLAETVGLVSSGTRTTGITADLNDPRQVEEWAEKAAAEHGRIDVVINNAGLTLPWRSFQGTSVEHFEGLISVNLWGAVHTTRAFLRHLLDRPEAALVNVGSLAGVAGFPSQVAYCTSKFALRGFTESLQAELHRTAVRVVLVVPGAVQTGIMANAPGISQEELAAATKLQQGRGITTADRAAAQIVVGIRRNRRRIVVGKDAAAIGLAARTFPSAYVGLTSRLGALVERRMRGTS